MSREKGQRYEALVEDYLVSQGYTILDRNWHAGVYGELDLICQKDKTIVFVEVKGRSSNQALEDGLNSINPAKARKLLYSMQAYLDYLEKKKRLFSPKTRFDLIVLIEWPDKTHQIEHVENICLWDFLDNSGYSRT